MKSQIPGSLVNIGQRLNREVVVSKETSVPRTHRIGQIGAMLSLISLLAYLSLSAGVANHVRFLYASLVKVATKLGIGL